MSNLPINKKSSMDEEYQEMLATFENAYFYPDPPDGWYQPLGKSGAPIPGFGFYCSKCKLNIPYGAPGEVKHCRRIDVQPKWNWFQKLFKKLPTWKIR
jgi:hypothetical protein